MQEHRAGRRPLDVAGVYFELAELASVRRLDRPGVRIEIVVTTSSYEEVIVFRGSGSPSMVLGTLHKSPDGLFMLTRNDPERSLVAPGVTRAYVSLEDAMRGLDWALSRVAPKAS